MTTLVFVGPTLRAAAVKGAIACPPAGVGDVLAASWQQLIADGRAAGLPARELAALAAWPKPDRKAADARLLLRTLATTRPKPPPALRVPRTWALRQLLNRRR